VIYKSEVKQWNSAGGSAYFFDWIPREGPNGGRVVIDGFYVHADMQIDTAAGATAQGEDFARVFNRIIVEQQDGKKRWNLQGDTSRVMSYLLDGADRYTETPDVAVSTSNAAADTVIYIPMTKRFTRNPEDFALPVDNFKQLTIEFASSTVFNIGSVVVSNIDFINFYIIADCHEELDLQIHCEDEVAATDMTSLTEGRLVTGGKLHDLVLHAQGASGGAVLTNLADVRCDDLQMPPFLRVPDLETAYRRKRDNGANLNSTMGAEIRSDPMATDQAAAVLVSDGSTSFYEGPTLQSVKLTLTNTVASLRALHRVVTPASAATRNRTSALYKVGPDQFVVKAASKTKRGVGDWPKQLRPFLPLKAELPGVKARMSY
jgi:hypothetical protein